MAAGSQQPRGLSIICHLTVYPPGVIAPDEEHLVTSAELNPHGFGWAVGTDEVYRSMDAVCAIAHFLPARARNPDAPAMFHARWAAGKSPRTLANCQPLVLDDGSLLAHNGGLFPVEGDRSDTRVFAEEILPRWDVDDLDQRAELEYLLGRNKMVIARPGKPLLILNDRQGIWLPDGSWHSNADYTGESHLCAGQCAACGTATPGSGPASLCMPCDVRYQIRRERLEAAR